jgi:hypothetical protein
VNEEDILMVLEAQSEGLDSLRDVLDLLHDIRNAVLELAAAQTASIAPAVAADTANSALFKGFGQGIPLIGGAVQSVTSFTSSLTTMGWQGAVAAVVIVALGIQLIALTSSFVVVAAGAATMVTAFVAGMVAMAAAATITLGVLGGLGAAVVFLADRLAVSSTGFADATAAHKELVKAQADYRTSLAELNNFQQQAQGQRLDAVQTEELTKLKLNLKNATLELALAQNAVAAAPALTAVDPLAALEQHISDAMNALGQKAAPMATQIIGMLDSMVDPITRAGSSLIDWFGERLPKAMEIVRLAAPGVGSMFMQLGGVIGHFVDQMIPVLVQVFQNLGPTAIRDFVDAVQGLLNNLLAFVKWFQENWPKLLPIVQQIMDQAGRFIQEFGREANKLVQWFIANWPEIAKTARDLEPVLRFLEAAVEAMFTAFLVGMRIEEAIVSFFSHVAEAVAGLFNKLGELNNRLGINWGGVVLSMVSAFNPLINMLGNVAGGIQFVLGLLSRLPGAAHAAAGSLSGVTSAITGGAALLNQFQSGGVVPGPIGWPQLAIVHGGERVLTVEQQQQGAGSGSRTVNVYQYFTGNDPAAIAAAVDVRIAQILK